MRRELGQGTHRCQHVQTPAIQFDKNGVIDEVLAEQSNQKKLETKKVIKNAKQQ